jgi:hypothetical protein
MKKGKSTLLFLTVGFLIAEIIFNYSIIIKGDDDILGAGFKSIFLLLFILLFSKGLKWAKWVLSILLILYGLLCILAGLNSGIIYYFLGLYYLFFGVYLHLSRNLNIFSSHRLQDESSGNLANTIDQLNTSDEQKPSYPRLVNRYKAILIDAIILMIIMIALMNIVDGSKYQTAIMVSVGISLLMTYEPLLTAYSRTVGQRLMKIKVRNYLNPSKKISVLNAYIRWVTKALLGWLSFITIGFDTQRRAIHDIASDSVMVCTD